jgi:hypothetical protein
MRRHFKAIFSIAPIALLSVICALSFSVPPQVHELYRAMAEAISLHEPWAWSEPIKALASLVCLSIGILLTTLGLSERLPVLLSYKKIRWFAVPISVMPLVGAAIGCASAAIPNSAIQAIRSAMEQSRAHYLVTDSPITPAQAAPIARRFAENISAFSGILTLFSVLLIVCSVVVALFAGLFVRRRNARPVVSARSATILIFGLTALSVALLAPSNAGVLLSQALTPIVVLCLFFLLLLGWVGYLRVLTRITGWPFVPTLICMAVMFSAFDLNDNHKIRTGVAKAPDGRQNPVGFSGQFKAWFASRLDRADYSGHRYPIYVIAAQGGGMYAAYHAATFLASVQDECPNFAHHIFAISGVSGGSVGASVFVSLMKQLDSIHSHDPARAVTACSGNPQSSTLLVDATAEILSQDFLSPVEAGLLFPDFFQQFLFWPVPAFDRARSLEYSLERSWSKTMASERFAGLRGPAATAGNPLSEPYLSHWNPEARSVPALIFNTTEVDSGRRRAISPFTFRGIDLKFLPLWTDIKAGPGEDLSQMPMSTAAFLSARFSWITPAAWFYDIGDGSAGATPVRQKTRIVDGGYFENSGIVTAMDLVDAMDRAMSSDESLAAMRDKIEINLITLNSKEFDVPTFSGLGEVLAPINTMMNTRSARAPIETAQAGRLMTGVTNPGSREAAGGSIRKNLLRFDLSWLGYPLPLGWRLSPVTRMLVSFELGFRDRCNSDRPDLPQESPDADCLRKILFRQLAAK